MQAQNIFCKFSHNASAQGAGNRVRLYTGPDQTYQSGRGFVDIDVCDRHETIIGLISIGECIIHVITDRHVYELDAHRGPIEVRKIAPTLDMVFRRASDPNRLHRMPERFA
jgi:hypothetical protein